MPSHNICSTNIKGPKKIWVPKVEKSNGDAHDDTNIFASSYTSEEIKTKQKIIGSLSYCTP